MKDAVLQDVLGDPAGKSMAGAFQQIRQMQAVQTPAPDQAGLATHGVLHTWIHHAVSVALAWQGVSGGKPYFAAGRIGIWDPEGACLQDTRKGQRSATRWNRKETRR